MERERKSYRGRKKYVKDTVDFNELRRKRQEAYQEKVRARKKFVKACKQSGYTDKEIEEMVDKVGAISKHLSEEKVREMSGVDFQ